jgi:hypothetical protein
MRFTSVIILLCSLCAASCGSSIKSAKKFVPNKAPMVTTFTADYIGTDTSYSQSKLYSGMPFLITVNASDPEGNKLTYNITSTKGTFGTQTVTATGVSCRFYIGSIAGSDIVSITLTVTDLKNASYVQTLDVGTGKTGPGLTITPSNSMVSASGEEFISISCDSKGVYRVFNDNTITRPSEVTLGSTGLNDYDDENESVKVPVYGSLSSAKSDGIILVNNTKNYIWVVFRDNNSQNAVVGCTMYVDGTLPYVKTTSPADSGSGVSLLPAISMQFNKAMNSSTLTTSTITLANANGDSVAGTVDYNESAYTSTFTPAGSLANSTKYTVTVSSTVEDSAGNAMGSSRSFSFMTVSSGTIPNVEFSPAAGTYTGTQSVTISNSDSSATILYTTDNTIPTCVQNPDGSYTSQNGTVYSSAITVNRDTTIRAIAYATGKTSSTVIASSYNLQVTAPEFEFTETNTTTGAGTLAITSSTSGAVVYYTTDGTDPSTGSSLGSSQTIAINRKMKVRAIAKCSDMTNSNEISETYSVRAATPVFSLKTGSTFDTDQTLYLSSDSGTTIYYTINDAKDPTIDSTAYSFGINLAGTASGETYTIKAIAVKDGLVNSALQTATFTVAYGTTSTPAFSLPEGPYSSTQSLTITCPTSGATIYYTTDGNEPSTSSSSDSGSITLQINKTTTVKAFAVKSPKNNSSVMKAIYTLKTPNPTAYIANGYLYVSCASGTTAYYSPSQTVSSASDTEYSAPVAVSSSTYYVVAGLTGWSDSDPVTATTTSVTAVSVSPSNIALTYGETVQLSAAVTPSNASLTTVTWVSSAETIATVSSTGLVTALSAEGKATITAKSVMTQTVSNVCTVTVTKYSTVTTSTSGSGIGAKTIYSLSGVTFSEVQAINATPITFPMGTGDTLTGTISTPFVIAETITTYELWSVIYNWATDSKNFGTSGVYSFANPGAMGAVSGGANTSGGAQQPVTFVSWRTAIVWCNALTEYYNAHNGTATDLDCVYYTDSTYTTPLRTSTTDATVSKSTSGSQDCPYIKSSGTSNTVMTNCTATGFRLPTSAEFEYAARYIGTTDISYAVDSTDNGRGALTPGYYWTPGTYASGATVAATDATATAAVAVYGTTSTMAVKSKTANALGLYDMSGNMWQWCFDWQTVNTSSRQQRGCYWGEVLSSTQVGYARSANIAPLTAGNGEGFRFARNK